MGVMHEWLMAPRPRVDSKFTAEIMASMMFHFIGSVSPTPWANGIALMVLVFYAAKTSGAHLNPAVSLTFMLLGYTNPIEFLVYVIAQVAGCVLGALWIALLVPGLFVGGAIDRVATGPVDGCFIPKDGLTPAGVFGWEAITTWNFITIIMTVVWFTVRKKGYGVSGGPLLIGLALLANALVSGQFTGGAMNPARVLGSAIVFRCGNSQYIGAYIGGEMLAGALAPLAICPWYGIAVKSWYIRFLPMRVKRLMKSYQHSLCIGASTTGSPDGGPSSNDRPSNDM